MLPLMLSVSKRVVVICAASAALAAGAQPSPMIAGAVYEDRAALAVRSGFTPAAGVTVRLYGDSGDAAPGADDRLIETATTDGSGVYLFAATQPGAYWVAVDSRSLAPRSAWAEQTFGPAGSLCAQPDGTSRTTYFEGVCFGGRTSGSDDASSLASSEHLALVRVSEPATRIDFAFSFNTVTSVGDGDGVQGSLRQFVVNANAITGPNEMRFVPLQRAPEQARPTVGVPSRWWRIVLSSPLPELSDDDTTIDGTAYNFLSAATVNNAHPGRFGETPTIRPDEPTIPRLEKPELELIAVGDAGITCTARCGIRALAIHGAPTGILTRADARVEHVLIGTTPDGTVVDQSGSVALRIESGTTSARHLMAAAHTTAGVLVGREGRIDAERLDISRCGTSQSGGAIVLLSGGSSIRSSLLAGNPGAAIILGALDGSAPAIGNTIDGCTISGSQAGVLLASGSSQNVITRNDFMWNRLGGVTVAPFETAPLRNRISANRFGENGLRPIVFDLSADPNAASPQLPSCERIATAPNAGIMPPRIETAQVIRSGNTAGVTISGRACPDEIVEIYQSSIRSDAGAQDGGGAPGSAPQAAGATAQLSPVASIGEFNYLGATNTRPDGTFEATFPLTLSTPIGDRSRSRDEVDVWARDVLQGSDATARAFSAIAIDAAGNTSEMSVRRRTE